MLFYDGSIDLAGMNRPSPIMSEVIVGGLPPGIAVLILGLEGF